MPFDVIVHAPTLRMGARLNIAEADQALDTAPGELVVGSEVRLRFGVCCPDRACGTIVERDPETLALAIGNDVWPLRRGEGGVTSAGLVSEDWYVASGRP